MYIELDDTAASHILWHDADVASITINRLVNGGITIGIQLELHDDEHFEAMRTLGLKSSLLHIEYHNVWRCIGDIRGDSLPREVIIDWEIIQDSGIIKQLKAVEINPTLDVHLRHHQYRFSGGTSLDVIFEEMYVAQQNSE